ncbi:MAG: methyltransferase domain-containing protein [Alphaproteobacteria bacterium]|nr:methyltransferase domain-containing protein [Alphaproteobacteria bacterium]
MFHDIRTLINFYDADLGQSAAKIIFKKIKEIWPNLHHQKILGIGYPIPFLEDLIPIADRFMMAMPAAQGIVQWPKKDVLNSAFLTYEEELPLPDCCVDYILVMHTLENTESTSLFLRECWRVLADHGKILLLLPNRKGMWSQLSKTPFGHGRPFTTRQIRNLLEKSSFSFLKRERMLYFPPINKKFILRYANTWEKTGRLLYRSFSGALLIEAQKNLFQECKIKIGYKVAFKPQTVMARQFKRKNHD